MRSSDEEPQTERERTSEEDFLLLARRDRQQLLIGVAARSSVGAASSSAGTASSSVGADNSSVGSVIRSGEVARNKPWLQHVCYICIIPSHRARLLHEGVYWVKPNTFSKFYYFFPWCPAFPMSAFDTLQQIF